ncbi:MAG: hypothetical protein R2774_16035 [Saprospiraceae bacterium]
MPILKQFIFAIVITWMLYTSVGCSKDDDTSINCQNNTECLVGKWRWVSSYGGIGGWTITPQDVGYDRILVISDTSYQEFIADTIYFQSKYSIEMVTNQTFCTDSIYINVESHFGFCFTASQDSLLLREQCFDCFDHVYIREN